MQVIVDDLLVSYNRIGSGKKIILFLHGWADPSETFDKLASELADDYNLVMLDLAGFGNSQHPPVPWDIPDYSRYVAGFVNKTGLKPDAIVGHSNGGAIAINAISGNLLKAKKLVLLASSGVRSHDSFRKKMYIILAKPAKLILLPLPKSAQRKLKKNLYQKIGSDLYAAEHMGETFKKIVNYDVRAEAKKILTPTILIYGDQDWITPVEQGQILAKLIKDSKLEIIPGSGHFLHQDKPVEVAAKISNFIK